jgi:hypothetical protein
MLYALRYYWRVSRGHRLRPWSSPYLRWRLETFFGAAQLPARDSAVEFFRLLWRERHRLKGFLRWAKAMEDQPARLGFG